MLCKKPFIRDGLAHGCGQCLPCRINHKRTWTSRILLEALSFKQNSFITLTYTDEELPNGANLRPSHLKNFFKRLRKKIRPQTIRYFAVGEYGTQTQRPHYHAIIFNGPMCHRGRTEHRLPECCPTCTLYREAWCHGVVDVGSLSKDSAAYTCGYTTKKMTKKDDPRLNDRYPEFARMSNRPGIGASSLNKIIDALISENFEQDFLSTGDVPSTIIFDGKLHPLGRYLRSKIREEIYGWKNSPPHKLQEYKDSLLQLCQENSGLSPKRLKLFSTSKTYEKLLNASLQKKNKQKILTMEKRHEIFETHKQTKETRL